MSRPIYAVIHQQALRHNLNIAKQQSPLSKVFAVVKANAYGHGIENVFDALNEADGFALLDIEEAIRVRNLGWNGPILLLEGIFRETDLELCMQHNLSFSVHSNLQVSWLEKFTQTAQFDIYLKLNSGMNRLGFQPEDYVETYKRLKALSCVANITHMTHFSDADGTRFGEQGINYQLDVFNKITSTLPGERSISNSAAILNYGQFLHSDVVRSGIMLYGSSPNYPINTAQDWQLEPSMSLRSEIIAIQHVKPQQTIGYGSTYLAETDMVIGIVACGYADGYQRTSKTMTPVLVDGQRTGLIGRVSMDMLAVDLTHLPDAHIGSEVVLWGKSSSGDLLSIDTVASMSETIGYELMCAVTKRVKFFVEH
ncbi:alanine racemase [Acinetobacter baumannii]|uniref:alanine racemase n=1 Tax=Acinetobacter baumannii TaxID=470 RepID=UPI00244CA197|nr:alanine racemase [Acinetobacter baumannii]MDH2528309.1 alanine racemase [Acinetobacter baumannii]